MRKPTDSELSLMPAVLDTADIARVLGRSIRSVQQLCVAGALPAVKLGARWYIGKAKLMALLGEEVPPEE